MLLFGVCRTIKPTGPLEGLLGGRFLTAFAATLFSMAAKACLLGYVVVAYNDSPNSSVLVPIKMTIIIFLPTFLLALFSTIGFSKNSLKILLIHPELVIMPTGYHTIAFLNSIHISLFQSHFSICLN